jgi:phosphoserine aminotransferase
MSDWRGSGMSVMEMSHRGKEFMSIHAQAQALLRELMALPPNYKTLFMQGGAIAENAIVPMNMLRGKAGADYIDTGEWSRRSIEEAARYGRVNVAATSKDSGYTTLPARDTWRLDPEAAYVHICSNETIGGVQYHFTPDVGEVPLVADMSSEILSRPVDVSRYGLIYGGAQKNIGPAGLTIVIVREDLIGHALHPFVELGRQVAHPRLLTVSAAHRIGAAVDLYRHRRHQLASSCPAACCEAACCCASTSRTASAARASAWAVS